MDYLNLKPHKVALPNRFFVGKGVLFLFDRNELKSTTT